MYPTKLPILSSNSFLLHLLLHCAKWQSNRPMNRMMQVTECIFGIWVQNTDFWHRSLKLTKYDLLRIGNRQARHGANCHRVSQKKMHLSSTQVDSLTTINAASKLVWSRFVYHDSMLSNAHHFKVFRQLSVRNWSIASDSHVGVFTCIRRRRESTCIFFVVYRQLGKLDASLNC